MERARALEDIALERVRALERARSRAMEEDDATSTSSFLQTISFYGSLRKLEQMFWNRIPYHYHALHVFLLFSHRISITAVQQQSFP